MRPAGSHVISVDSLLADKDGMAKSGSKLGCLKSVPTGAPVLAGSMMPTTEGHDGHFAASGSREELAADWGVQLSSAMEMVMADLTSKARNKLPAKDFAEPEKRAYPIEDKAHARNAKARASQQVKAGKMSKAEEAKIDKKADGVLKK